MCSRFLKLTMILLVCALSAFARESLKVCADPDNLPFSNRAQQGFDNKIAKLLAGDLDRNVEFVWQRAGRGFVREHLDKGVCDVLVGVPQQFRPVLTTAPYYSSSYVFVTRKDQPEIASFDDPRLKSMKIGVQVLEDDYTPAARALSRRGLTPNIVAFEAVGDQAQDIVSAVARKKVDVAVVWGPLAGYYAARQRTPLRLSAVEPALDPPMLPFRFSMSVGVQKKNTELRDALQKVLERDHAKIEAILRAYAVPEFPAQGGAR
jgi:mxaJ protein